MHTYRRWSKPLSQFTAFPSQNYHRGAGPALFSHEPPSNWLRQLSWFSKAGHHGPRWHVHSSQPMPGRLCYTDYMPNQAASLLWRGILALHHHKWLSAPAVVRKCTEPRPVPASVRASAARHGSPGIWQPRFYDFVVFSEKKRVEKLRYMHRNPVKRGLVLQPEQGVWSCYRNYAYDDAGLVVVNEPQRAELRARKVS